MHRAIFELATSMLTIPSFTIILILWASKFITCKVLDKQDRKSYPSIHTRVKRKSMIGKANHAHIMCMNAWVKGKAL